MKTLINNAFIYSAKDETFVKGSLLFSDRIIEIGNVSGDADCTIDANEALLLPGFVDVHTHGRAGYDFTDANIDSLKKMAKSYASVGTTSLFPTLASAEYSQLLSMSDKINSVFTVYTPAFFILVFIFDVEIAIPFLSYTENATVAFFKSFE